MVPKFSSMCQMQSSCENEQVYSDLVENGLAMLC